MVIIRAFVGNPCLVYIFNCRKAQNNDFLILSCFHSLGEQVVKRMEIDGGGGGAARRFPLVYHKMATNQVGTKLAKYSSAEEWCTR